MITSAWIDTETTGIDPHTSGVFEVALLIYQGKQCVFENLYQLNPLNSEVKWSEEAFEVNGILEETILSYPPLEGVVFDIASDLRKFLPPEKYVFAGYNCGFDCGHIGALLSRGGFKFDDFFNGRLIDVYDLVKRAADGGYLPKTENQKLKTMTKALKIEHGGVHTAMGDIKATRQLYERIWQIYRSTER